MEEDDRVGIVRHLLFEFVKSPSLRHIRDPNSLIQLSLEIVRRIDRESSYWAKWNPLRETLLKSSLGCWIPVAPTATLDWRSRHGNIRSMGAWLGGQ